MKKLMAILILIVLFGNALLIHSHEKAHVVIFKYYGVESVVEYSLAGAFTVPQNEVPVQNQAFIYGLHAMNDAVGYQVMILFNALVLFCFFILLAFIHVGRNRTS